MRAILLLTLLVAVPTRALDEWTTRDTTLQLTFTTITTLDWMQTRVLVAEGYLERNPVLGEHPSRARINTLIGGAILGHAAVARLLPKPYRTFWQIGFIYLEGAAVYGNHKLGIRIQF